MNKSFFSVKKLSRASLAFSIFCLTCIHAFGQKDTTNKFRAIGLKNDKVFIEYFKNFKKIIENNDKNAIEKLFVNSYPTINVTIDKPNGKKHETLKLEIKNQNDFYKFYNKVFDKRMRSLIARQNINNLTINYMGVMLDSGQIWWRYDTKTGTIKIASINNIDAIFPHNKYLK